MILRSAFDSLCLSILDTLRAEAEKAVRVLAKELESATIQGPSSVSAVKLLARRGTADRGQLRQVAGFSAPPDKRRLDHWRTDMRKHPL
jgi:hypothetical protein